jgi:hypothetical protein
MSLVPPAETVLPELKFPLHWSAAPVSEEGLFGRVSQARIGESGLYGPALTTSEVVSVDGANVPSPKYSAVTVSEPAGAEEEVQDVAPDDSVAAGHN